MKTLILMRHCKSSWTTPIADVERPLNARGRASAVRLGEWLRDNGYIPREILCSSAMRTMETTDLLGFDMSYTPQRALYLASVIEMHSALRSAQTEIVLMVGHNPGIAEFAETLALAAPDHSRFEDYPTGATTIFEFDVESWSNATRGVVRDFVIPRELLD